MKDLQIIQARSYLNMMSIRTKDKKHEEHLKNALEQIEFLEIWRGKAIKMIKELQQSNIKMGLKVSESDSKLSLNKNEVSLLEMENTHLKEQINNLINNVKL